MSGNVTVGLVGLGWGPNLARNCAALPGMRVVRVLKELLCSLASSTTEAATH